MNKFSEWMDNKQQNYPLGLYERHSDLYPDSLSKFILKTPKLTDEENKIYEFLYKRVVDKDEETDMWLKMIIRNKDIILNIM